MSVNRKRKKLEEDGLLQYFTSLDTTEEGTGVFHSQQLYIIKFSIGITRKELLEKIEQDKRMREFNAEHIEQSYIGEKDGHLALIMIFEARTEHELIETFNGKIIPIYKEYFGENCIREVITTKIITPIRIHHNYLPLLNIEKGKIKRDWSDEWIFVG